MSYPVEQALIIVLLWLALCVHAWIAVHGYSGQIRHSLRRIADANRLQIVHPDLRRSFLAGANPDAFGAPLPRLRFLGGPSAVVIAIAYILCGIHFLLHVVGVFVQ